MDNQLLDSPLHDETPNYREYASFGRRLGALFIDGLILSVVQTLVLGLFGLGTSTFFQKIMENDIENDSSAFFSMLFPIYGIIFLIRAAYFTLLESSERQGTFGKQALNIVVTDTNGRRLTFGKALLRYITKFISGITLLIGYIIQPFTERRQALHDIIAGTLVYKKPNYFKG